MPRGHRQTAGEERRLRNLSRKVHMDVFSFCHLSTHVFFHSTIEHVCGKLPFARIERFPHFHRFLRLYRLRMIQSIVWCGKYDVTTLDGLVPFCFRYFCAVARSKQTGGERQGGQINLSRSFSICDVLQPAVRMVNISAMCFCVTCLFMI